jgi:ABC-2 type transport system permease protein
MRTEFLTVYRRNMIKFSRSKSLLFSTLIQPVLWLALYGLSMSNNFGLLAPSGSNIHGGVSVSYMTFLAGGVVGMTILFTCLYEGYTLLFDKQYGLMKEMIVSPMPRSHILIGITLGGVTKSLIQTFVILVFGFLLGVRFFEGFTATTTVVSVLGFLLFVVLFAMGLMFVSTAIAMTIEGHDTVQTVITLLTMPLFFASNALYPLESLPLAIRAVSYVNPLSYFINGIRYFGIGSDFYSLGIHYTFGFSDVLLSLGFLVGFDIIMFLVTVRAFGKARVD